MQSKPMLRRIAAASLSALAIAPLSVQADSFEQLSAPALLNGGTWYAPPQVPWIGGLPDDGATLGPIDDSGALMPPRAAPVPEPAAIALWVLGVAGLLAARRRG